MKKIFLGIITLLLMLPLTVNAEEKVKVYIFEAGGCPACEAEMEYLKGLDDYNKTFEVIEKELYIDHIKWEEGKDYQLGKAVAEYFYNLGFTDATYQATPFIVVSDIYAASAYNPNLIEVINEARKKGDKDVVSEIESTLDITPTQEKKETKVKKSNNAVIIASIVIVLGVMAFLIKTSISK